MMKWVAIPVLVLAAVLGVRSPAFGIVDMNSGSFANTWVDVQIDEPGFHFTLLRAYKSRTLFDGIFGFGWCSLVETRVYGVSEDLIRLSECGDGAEDAFRRVGSGAVSDSADRRRKRLEPALRRDGFSDYETLWLSSELDDETGLNGYEKQLGLYSRKLPQGVFRSGSGDTITVTAAGVTLDTAGGRERARLFDPWGRLVQTTMGADAVVSVTRMGRQGIRLAGGGHVIDLLFDAAGKYVVKVEVDGAERASYVYSELRPDNSRELVSMRNQWARHIKDTYDFEYNEYKNLTRATWPDRKSIALTYDNEKDLVTGFEDRDGCKERYAYAFGKEIPAGFEREVAELSSFSSPFTTVISAWPDDDPRYHYTAGVEKVCGAATVARNVYVFQHGLFDTPFGRGVQQVYTAVRTDQQMTFTGYSDNASEFMRLTSPLAILWRETYLSRPDGQMNSLLGSWGVFQKTFYPSCGIPKQIEGFLTLEGKRIPARLLFNTPDSDSIRCSASSTVVTLGNETFEFQGSPSGTVTIGDMSGQLRFGDSDFITSCHLTKDRTLLEDVGAALAGNRPACTGRERAALLLAAVVSWRWI